jgi:hypothetical protein
MGWDGIGCGGGVGTRWMDSGLRLFFQADDKSKEMPTYMPLCLSASDALFLDVMVRGA